MSNNEVTNRDLLQIITQRMDQGFSEVIKRQDTTNGRVRDGEMMSAEFGVRIKNLEREIFSRGGRRKVDPVTRPAGNISDRDIRVALGTLGGASALLAFFWKVLPLALKALTP